MTNHPCLKCGACCAFFRVSFHWTETYADSYGVPEGTSHAISPYVNSMNGTDQINPSCQQLRGIIGESTSCDIYANRPNACRAFKASFEDGTKNIQCDQARASKGLSELSLRDWILIPAGK